MKRLEGLLGSAGFLTLLVLIGVTLRLWAYLADQSLWLDEILLTRNIVGLPLRDLLTGPLLLDQVAPRGFLLLERWSVLAFGENGLALRLVPFLGGIAGLLLFRRLAERTLDGLAVPFAVTLCAIGIPFIRYGAEVKQYEFDATVATLLLLVATGLRRAEMSRTRLALAGLTGFVVIWFSQASVLVMGGIGVAFAVQWLSSRDRSTGRALAITMPLWAAASVLAIVAGTRSMSPSTFEFMHDFWKGGFAPRPLASHTALRWLWDSALSAFTDPTLLRYPWPSLFLGAATIGLVALWRIRRDVALLLLGPVAIGLVAAIAQQYPFRGRLMLYLVPGLFLSIAAGAEWIRRTVGRVGPVLGGVVMLAILAPPVAALVKTPPPYVIEPHEAIFGYLQSARRPGDVVYVFPLSRVGALYYGPRYGLEPRDWVTGICDRENTRAYLRDIDRYRGVSRLWLYTSGARPFRLARATVQQYLRTIGAKRDSLWMASLSWGTVSLELYDLSDPARLRLATAETFPALPMPTDPRPGCRPWARPSPLDSLH